MCLCNEFNSMRVANKHISESESESESEKTYSARLPIPVYSNRLKIMIIPYWVCTFCALMSHNGGADPGMSSNSADVP